MPETLIFPNTLYGWPWPRKLNTHYNEAKKDSEAWLESFHAFDPQAQRAFNKCDFSLLASLCYPIADKDQLRAGCDLMNLFFVFDEYSDVENEYTVRRLGDIVMDALRNPDKRRPDGESVLGEIARQFWQRTIPIATATCQKRFIEQFDWYISSVVQQAEDRSHNRLRSIESYMDVRRATIGAYPSFTLLELAMHIPDEVMAHPAMDCLLLNATDMVILANDMYSYNVEQARGDDIHNIVTVVMHQLKTDLDGAMRWIAESHKEMEKNFMAAKAALPKWGEDVDKQVAQYVDGVAYLVRANDSWSFESGRYFGGHGREIQQSRAVVLLPKLASTRT